MEEFQINQNKETLLELKALSEQEDLVNAYKAIGEIRKKWHFSRDDASFYEQELQDKFDEYLNVIYSKLKVNESQAEENKKNIIEKAQKCLENGDFRKTGPMMKELLENWKIAGKANKEADDELWNKFNEIRNAYYEKRQAYYDDLNRQFKENEESKKKLIAEAVEANKIDDIKQLTDKMNQLMASWKAVKSATKEVDEQLWAEFKAQRDIFFNKRNSYFEAMKQVYENRAQQKQELITRAKHCLAMSEFTDEEIQEVEEIRKKWKEIGSAGREFENDLWEKFSTVINRYLDNMKYYR